MNGMLFEKEREKKRREDALVIFATKKLPTTSVA